MGAPTITFSKLIDRLHQYYGSPPLSPSTDPLELIIWENIAYLASDEHQAGAFATLKRTIGIRPEQILAAKHSAHTRSSPLAAIGKAGILPDVSAEKLLKVGVHVSGADPEFVTGNGSQSESSHLLQEVTTCGLYHKAPRLFITR